MFLKRMRKTLGENRLLNKEIEQVKFSSSPTCKRDRYAARIVRLLHSIEKGLSIENPRAEFGYEKIKTLYGWIQEYLAMGDVDRTCVYMAADAFTAYCEYHDKIGVSTEKIEEIKAIANELVKIKQEDKVEGTFGGVLNVKKSDMCFDQDVVEKLFKTRHSIREFKKGRVPKELIEKAVELAQTAPSACNRQAVRVYVVDSQKFKADYGSNLQGVGNFVDNTDQFLLITGKISAYEEHESKQFIVTAGIFAGYLSLALHALGLGACVVQRSVRLDLPWVEFCKKNNIPADEQIVCMIGIGLLKDEMKVPVSKRFTVDKILRYL